MSASTKPSPVLDIDDTQMRGQCRKRVISDLGARGADLPNKRRLARVGEADQAHFGDKPELQAKTMVLSRPAFSMATGRLVGGRSEASIPPTTNSTASYEQAFAFFAEIAEDLAALVIEDHRTQRHRQHKIFTVPACSPPAFSVATAFRTKVRMVAEVDEGVAVRAGNEPNRTAFSTVATVRPPARDELLSTKANNPPPSVAGPHFDTGFVDEHRLHVSLLLSCRGSPRDGPEVLRGRSREDANEASAPTSILEPNDAAGTGEKRIVFTTPHVLSWLEGSAPLADQDSTARDQLATERFHAETL